MKLISSIGIVLLTVITISWAHASPLEPVKTDHPRDTMRTYLEAMNDYVEALDSGDQRQLARLQDAIRTFNLQEIPYVIREEKGREAAIFLKEILDRVIVIDYSKVPDTADEPRWRLKGTEIVISKVQEGERAGEFLFSPDTVSRLKDFYTKVEDLPYLEGTTRGAGYERPWQERVMPSWAQGESLGLRNWQWLGLLIAIFIGLVVKLLVEMTLKLARSWVERKRNDSQQKVLSAVEKPIGLLAAGLTWLIALHYLRFEGWPLAVLLGAVEVLIGISLVWAAYRLVDVASGYLGKLAQKTESDLDDHLVPLATKSMRVFVVVFGVLVVVQNLGFNVMSLLAGLGLGGLAFALAAKDTAANLFGSIMILLDRPFSVGDWIISSGVEGNVEEIGFRSTRLRTFYNSQISVPNSVLATATIDNMGRREFRRIKTTLGLTYDTPPEKLEAFLEGIKNIIKANPYTRKDYYHVVFESYGDFSLNILLYCFLKVPDWAAELVERQNLYLEILRLAQELGIEFAFPTQTLHMETFPEKQPTRLQQELPVEQLKSTAKEFGPQGSQAKPRGLGIFTPAYLEEKKLL